MFHYYILLMYLNMKLDPILSFLLKMLIILLQHLLEKFHIEAHITCMIGKRGSLQMVSHGSSGRSTIRMIVFSAASTEGTGILSSSVPSSFKCSSNNVRMYLTLASNWVLPYWVSISAYMSSNLSFITVILVIDIICIMNE